MKHHRYDFNSFSCGYNISKVNIIDMTLIGLDVGIIPQNETLIDIEFNKSLFTVFCLYYL